MLRLNNVGRLLSARAASIDADLTVIGAGPGGYVAAIKVKFKKKIVNYVETK